MMVNTDPEPICPAMAWIDEDDFIVEYWCDLSVNHEGSHWDRSLGYWDA